MEKEEVEQVVFRDVLVEIRKKLTKGESILDIVRWITAWIWTIDHEQEKKDELQGKI